jgi:hypothetical protein
VLKAALSVDLAAPRPAAPIAYGYAKATSAGELPRLDFDATARRLRVSGALPHGAGVLVLAARSASRPFAGGSLYVDSLAQALAFSLDETGATELEIHASVGTALHAQALLRDPGDAHGLGMTNGLRIDL